MNPELWFVVLKFGFSDICWNFDRIVERSELAALEFIMSKQARGRVRIGAGNTAGVRTVDVFDEVEKFKARYANHNASKTYSKVIFLCFSPSPNYNLIITSSKRFLKLIIFEKMC